MCRRIAIVCLIAVTATSCGKKVYPVNPPGTYMGVVIHNICCQAVIQTTGSNHLGQASWTDSNKTTHTVYENVFRVSNPCQFGNHKAGDTIRFKVIPQQTQNCACCLLFLHTPAASYPIEVVP